MSRTSRKNYIICKIQKYLGIIWIRSELNLKKDCRSNSMYIHTMSQYRSEHLTTMYHQYRQHETCILLSCKKLYYNIAKCVFIISYIKQHNKCHRHYTHNRFCYDEETNIDALYVSIRQGQLLEQQRNDIMMTSSYMTS